ncbi:NK-tumor recognition protein isoform X2 [Genypterus blacodes]|uniref:NK-tumor recognition protein isoform X2 n=1 Tax=Genypterus blacodes TaxID=154954 RepID=UPI003F7670DD
MGVKDGPQCYFDVELNRDPVGRIVFQLFSDVCPKTSKNFLCLCTGERGSGKITGKKLCFKGSTFHRVVKNFMIQGGDFTEGNGRGGESIYGGYFEDENFTLKHDKAFLLSMANRGKDTNGSQFFITTKMAPHLDGVHVVFGLVTSGFEVIKKIEGLKADSASRPYADVRVVDCGQLFTKSANDVLEGKRKRTSHSADSSLNSQESFFSSSMESQSESDQKEKHRTQRRRAKSKRSKKRRRESKREKKADVLPDNQSPVKQEKVEGDEDVEKEQGGKREKPVVRPEEIPPVPENRFLLRRDVPSQEDQTDMAEKEESADLKPAVTKSGRKMKGRGTMRYHTPTRSKSRSASLERGSSETPPHWKEEMKRTKVYQPPNVERWSKGDNRWEDRSDSAWSRSAERSSDRSPERSGHHQEEKKEKKKAKHKKKAKKRKHSKKKSSKNKQPPPPPPEPLKSDAERSPSAGRRSKYRRSHSPSHSSSSQRYSSSRKRQQSSLSFRDSRSYSRSYTSTRSRSRGRSRSYSGSRSLSRSRSLSVSRSRSRSFSRSRSRSRSRTRSRYRSRSSSRKRSLSRSPRKRRVDKLKTETSVHMPEKVPDNKVVPPLHRVPVAPVPESVPVIPLSDSPPPSRWKPGQKPWKPSYVHIQEVKTKVTPSTLSSAGQAVDAVTEKNKTSATAKSLQEDSERDKTDKTLKPSLRSCSVSSRSKSDSRSYSRSRSRSLTRSRSRSPHQYRSRSSSCSRSGSERPPNKGNKEKNSFGKEWKAYYRSLRRIKDLDKYISDQTAALESKDSAGSEPSPDVSGSPRSGSWEKMKEKSVSQDQEEIKPRSGPAEDFNSKSEWDSDSDKVSLSKRAENKPQAAAQSCEVLDKRSTGWNSESDCEKVPARTLTVSEKEEGEASSESDNDRGRKTSEAVSARAHRRDAAGHTEGDPEKSTEPQEREKHKSKKKAKRKHKRKRRGETKSSSHQSKDKGKRSKRKHQKLKETFHWQPPLEFGEEEDEDESKKERRMEQKQSPAVKDKPNARDHKVSSSNKNPPEPPRGKGHISSRHSMACEPPRRSPHNNNNSNIGQESLDDMDICTPEHEGGTIVDSVVTQDPQNKAPELTLKTTSAPSGGGATPQLQSKEQPSAFSLAAAKTSCELRDEGVGVSTSSVINLKWKPLKGMLAAQNANLPPVTTKNVQVEEIPAPSSQAVRMEIKSKSRVRPGSLFDEVRKTARLNQRPRNQDSSSSEEESETRSPKKSRSVSSHRSHSRGWSHSSSRSRSRSRSSSYSSRSRGRSRRRRGRGRSRSRSSTYRSYRSHSRTYSRSHSRSHSYDRRRRSRSDSYDSYSSRSVSRRRGRRRSHSHRSSDRRSRSYRSSSRSTSRHRSHSRSSRYS